MKNPTEENYRQIVEIFRLQPKTEKKPLAVELAEANERMLRGEYFTLEEVKEIREKMDQFGLCGTGEE